MNGPMATIARVSESNERPALDSGTIGYVLDAA